MEIIKSKNAGNEETCHQAEELAKSKSNPEVQRETKSRKEIWDQAQADLIIINVIQVVTVIL